MTPEEIYVALGPRVLGYLRAHGVPDPDDVAGEVFLQVARDLRKLRDAEDVIALRRWVFTIARNRATDAARRARRRPRASGAEVPDQPAAPPAEPLDPQLVGALQQLTADQREVVALRFIADLPIEEVARMTRRSVGATKALQHRALENLRRSVSPEPPAAL